MENELNQTEKVNAQAGKIPSSEMLINIPRLITAYYAETPDVSIKEQKVSFGTSGHRGSAFNNSFNEAHVLAISQAICEYRRNAGIDGPLFLGIDTHALSEPARVSAVEVLAANGVEIMLAENDEYTPTPALSHAILTYNRNRKTSLADGIVLTPSHNPPEDGGFKYNPPHGGPAESGTTSWIEKKANELLAANLRGVKRISYRQALDASTTHRHDYLNDYVADLASVIDMESIGKSAISIGIDPLGGAGVRYWERIAEHYKLNLTIVNREIDPTFRFMTADWDGRIRMDPSSIYAMQSLIGIKDQFDVACACDADSDRHGIVTKTAGILPPNHYLTAAIFYLLQNRPQWNVQAAIGKTLVSSRMIDRVTAKLGRRLLEVPVGFKWFVDGLHDGSLCFGGEESAGASFVRRNGDVWTTDKDGIILALLAAEITARTERDPGKIYDELTQELGEPLYRRIDAPATFEQKRVLANLSAEAIKTRELAGEKILKILTHAPGNNASIGGLKVETENGWFAARPSGTENNYKIYAESFSGENHLSQLLGEAQSIVSQAFSAATHPGL